MNWRSFTILWSFIILALILGVTSIFIEPSTMKWALGIAALVLIPVGLALNSLMFSLRVSKRIDEVSDTLDRLEAAQDEIQQAVNEQREQSGSQSNIIPTLEAFSQFYMGYLTQKQGEEEKPEENE